MIIRFTTMFLQQQLMPEVSGVIYESNDKKQKWVSTQKYYFAK